MFSDSDDSYSSSVHGRHSRKRHRSPFFSLSPRRNRRPRLEITSFMSEMKELMSSMIGEQIRADLPAATVTKPLVATTPSNVLGYGDRTNKIFGQRWYITPYANQTLTQIFGQRWYITPYANQTLPLTISYSAETILTAQESSV